MKLTEVVDLFRLLYGPTALLGVPGGSLFPTTTLIGAPLAPGAVTWVLSPDPRIFRTRSALLDRLAQTQGVWNGPTFVLRGGVDLTEGLCIRVSPGRYFDALDSSDALTSELSAGLAAHRAGGSASDCLQAMPHRAAAQGGLLGPEAVARLWLGDARSAALGVAITFVCAAPVPADPTRYVLLAQRRSPHVAEDAGLFHVAPSFVLQPLEDRATAPGPPPLRELILQEAAEELFSLPESSSLADARKLPAIRDLRRALCDGNASLWITGLALDLISLRPELLGLLVVHDPSWSRRHLSEMRLGSHEFVGRLGTFELEDEELFGPRGPFAPGACVWSAAASASLALPLGRRLHDAWRAPRAN